MKEKEKELLKIKRVFSPKYVLTEKMIEPYLFFALFIALCFSMKKILYGIVIILILVLLIFIKLVLEKRRSNRTVMKFYEDRIEFRGNIFFFKVEQRVLKYSEIKDITVTKGYTFLEKIFQKKFGYGNLYVYPKKGTIISNGMQVELIADIDEKVEEIKKIVGDKIGNE